MMERQASRSGCDHLALALESRDKWLAYADTVDGYKKAWALKIAHNYNRCWMIAMDRAGHEPADDVYATAVKAHDG